MDTSEVRQKYLKFFEDEGHAIIPSASLRPDNDPTTLFVGSGMQPLLPFFLGEKHPKGIRLTNSQKCFRSEDIDEVGDNRHTTFFEMLGNWSLGDYFKEEQLSLFFKFLTEEVGIQKEKLWVTCFEGDDSLGISKDTESAEIWKGLGISEEHILFYGPEKNWWSRSGTPDKMPAGEPGGPDSEVFYEFTDVEHNKSFGGQCHPNCDCGRFMEIGNSVFMEYIKQKDGSFKPLPQKNVDFGGGLERITAAANDNADVFSIDALQVIIEYIEKTSGKKYDDARYTTAFRVIADHIRAVIFIIADGVQPSNTEQGYFVRRLIRRAVRYADFLGVPDGVLAASVSAVNDVYSDQYEIFLEKGGEISGIIAAEEEKFRKTLKKGIKKLHEMTTIFEDGARLPGSVAFELFTSYGFPYELTEEIVASEQKMTIDRKQFDDLMKKHQELSRSGSEQKFKGGLADNDEMSVKYHTATHLLHQALRNVLGDSVQQKGSNITPERMRFDFAFERKMTDEEKQKVEDIVNEQIEEAIPVTSKELPIEKAKELGAIGLFGEKYGDVVKVYTIGDFSLELCGGPHVTNTNQLGYFKIKKEESVSAGVRRIRATLE